MDCSPFLNWSEDADETVEEKAVVFRSLVATLMFQPSLDDSLEAKAVKFLESVDAGNHPFADPFLDTLASNSDHQAITTASMKMLKTLLESCSPNIHLTLVKADLIAQLVITLNPQSLSFAETVDIHTGVISNISISLWLATTNGLAGLETKDDDEDKVVYETVLQQVLVPSEQNRKTSANVSNSFCLPLDSKHCLCVIVVGTGITSLFAGTIGILSHLSPSIVAALSFSFAATLAQLLYQRQYVDQSIQSVNIRLSTSNFLIRQLGSEAAHEERDCVSTVDERLRERDMSDGGRCESAKIDLRKARKEDIEGTPEAGQQNSRTRDDRHDLVLLSLDRLEQLAWNESSTVGMDDDNRPTCANVANQLLFSTSSRLCRHVFFPHHPQLILSPRFDQPHHPQIHSQFPSRTAGQVSIIQTKQTGMDGKGQQKEGGSDVTSLLLHFSNFVNRSQWIVSDLDWRIPVQLNSINPIDVRKAMPLPSHFDSNASDSVSATPCLPHPHSLLIRTPFECILLIALEHPPTCAKSSVSPIPTSERGNWAERGHESFCISCRRGWMESEGRRGNAVSILISVSPSSPIPFSSNLRQQPEQSRTCESVTILLRKIRMEDLEDALERRLLKREEGDWGGVVSNWMVLRNLVGLNVGQFGWMTTVDSQVAAWSTLASQHFAS
ncbi:hypothetical protein BLNAU_14575 [Blattamonas nauphoetae]|uniref:Uncharacterized protein n=1 Tax=Blattamonas nauphoetae TaxID=2049346 RepID=A0ABQ9XIK4_9EUKA|nr:hypothetical protein BLNAU_14575 [Blattamonas nauphoetae]